MWFTRVSIGNPVLATMVMLAFVVLGLFSYQRLAVDQFPNIDFPTVVVVMDYPGASPEIVEAEVTKKVEEAVNTIAGISTLYSRSYEGTSVVIVEFNLDVDGRKAADDVREKVALIRPLLRDEVKEPRISRFDPKSVPIFNVAVLSEDGKGAPGKSPQELTTWARQVLQKRLENVRGVGSVSIVGGLDRQINVYLKPAALEALGIGADQVVTAVRSENQELPLGAIRSKEQERVVQINARLKRPEDFRDIVVARKSFGGSGTAGAPVRLWQVADIVDGPQEVESLALYNGQRTVLLSVQKSQGENTIEVVDGLQKALVEAKLVTPPGIRVEVNRDNSRSIRVSVANVKRTLFEGAALTILIVFLFLNSWRSTVITGLTLPIALIGTFLFMYVFGFTINTITMMALSLCVGLLIDDAIVVRENIVRHVQMGKSAHEAALAGTNEIGLAVLATTLSIVAVFLPIGFMGGIVGKFFHEFGLTIVAAVLISMFVSFTLDPMLSSVWHDPQAERLHELAAGQRRTLYDRTIGRVTGVFDRLTVWLSARYQAILRWALGHRLATLGIALATFVGAFFIIPILGAEFVPKADFSETQVNYYTPVGSSLEVTEMRARQVDAALRQMPEVRYTVTTINSGQAAGKIYAATYIRLADRKDRTRSVTDMAVPMREKLARIPGITVTNIGQTDLGGGKSLQFSIQGTDLGELERISKIVVARLAAIPGLVDLDTTLKPDKPTVAIEVRRDAASDAGLNVNVLANTLRTLVAGTLVGNWRAPDGENYDVNVRLAPGSRTALADLQRLPINVAPAADGSARVVRLSQVADVTPSTGPNQINRRDLNREINIDANAFGRSSGDVSTDIRKALDGIAWPPGYRYAFGGSTKNMTESFNYALGALGLAIVFIYMILASQFRSFLQPLALMSSLPLTLIGVVLALLAFRSTLNMFSIIGIVMLMGLVTKNAILLIDFAIRAQRGEVGGEGGGRNPTGEKMDRETALLYAAEVRLRPILMTTLAMVFGMVPLAFALSEGSEQRAPMGQAVIGGVITSSLLTLVVVPVVYCYLDDFSRWVKRRVFKRPPAVLQPLTAP
ncbi:MAG: efflux RND transporter permease subunit [Caldimonas sp.]